MEEHIIDMNEKNTLAMKLLHYFITEKNYTPIILQGAEDEIWLENLDEDYKIDSTEYLFLYISDLICKLNSDKEYYQDLFEMYKSSISSNFDIPEFKNIFDINFTITANDESMYEDIDEIIE